MLSAWPTPTSHRGPRPSPRSRSPSNSDCISIHFIQSEIAYVSGGNVDTCRLAFQVGPTVCGRKWMAVIDKADEAQLLATIDRWVEREVAPRVKEFDHADRWPAELVEQMKELGLFGATVSPEYGGLGLPATTYAEIVMRVSS